LRQAVRWGHQQISRPPIQEETDFLNGAEYVAVDDLSGHATVVGREHQLSQDLERIAGRDRLGHNMRPVIGEC